MKIKYTALLAIAAPILVMGGCAFFQSKAAQYVPITFTNESQDQVTAGLIGREFLEYRKADNTLSDKDVQVVSDWTESGSTWQTYKHVVGKNADEGYILYVNSDDDLTTSGKMSRRTEVGAWYLNIEARLGNPTWKTEGGGN